MKFDVLGVGNALVDETFYVDKSFVDATELFFNQFKSISYQEQEEILSHPLLKKLDPKNSEKILSIMSQSIEE